ncbi:hypothetical protein [Roseofilum sp. Guam]|nr:hypothetical protein [Roseofilum sp. Guam]MBP0029258.1 hypothetical protein [Roseofilum sp. Guam]
MNKKIVRKQLNNRPNLNNRIKLKHQKFVKSQIDFGKPIHELLAQLT